MSSLSLSCLVSLMLILRRKHKANLLSFLCSGGLILPNFYALIISSKMCYRPSLPLKVDLASFKASLRSFSFHDLDRGLMSSSTLNYSSSSLSNSFLSFLVPYLASVLLRMLNYIYCCTMTVEDRLTAGRSFIDSEFFFSKLRSIKLS